MLSRSIPQNIPYVGMDASSSLIQFAQGRSQHRHHRFIVKDLTKKIDLGEKFTHCTLLFVLQNIEDPASVIQIASSHLELGGSLFIVLNHPCFRIPRQSHWGIDEEKKLQYRRIDSYLSPQKIPIQTHPGKNSRVMTWSFHHPLSTYVTLLRSEGLLVSHIEEWVSHKKSVGGRAKMENRAREEIPLFLTLVAKKTSPA